MGVEHCVTAPYHPEANGIYNFFFHPFLIFLFFIHYSFLSYIHITIFSLHSMTTQQLNCTMTQCLRACIDEQKDWIVVLQSITMSYRSTRHDLTGKNPYEMMFGCHMHLPFELKTNAFTSIPQHIHNDDLGEILPQSTVEEIAGKFTVIDKIRTVIHDVASDEIA